MLEYTKTILEKVRFDQDLVLKELSKASENLKPRELRELYTWYNENFTNKAVNIMAYSQSQTTDNTSQVIAA